MVLLQKLLGLLVISSIRTCKIVSKSVFNNTERMLLFSNCRTGMIYYKRISFYSNPREL